MRDNLIKVLLVDDEFLVCSFLRNIISWEEHGFTIIGQAGSGNEALKKIPEDIPDLLFLDVSMPDMDGIELIQRLNELYPRIKVIMLSSYSDYEYVRVAMKMNAVDYLLKHQINSEDLIKLLSTLHFENKSDAKTLRNNTVINEATDILRDSRVRSFFECKQSAVPAPLLDLYSPILVAAKIKFSITDKDIQSAEEFTKQGQFMYGIFSTCIQICDQEHKAKVIYLGNSTLVLLFSANAGENVSEQKTRIMRVMSVVHDALLKYHNTYINWEISGRCERLEALPTEYGKVLELFDTDKPADNLNRQSYQLSIEQERQLVLGVLTKNKSLVHKTMFEIFQPLRGNQTKNMEISLIAGDLLTLSVKLYSENKISFSSTNKHEVLNADIENVYMYFNEIFINLINSIDIVNRYSKTVSLIISYVEQHYKKDICLQSISEFCGKNTSYVSTIFKKETGISLIKFINRVRVFYAGKLMLMEGISPTRVYELVGFSNYNNFFNLFKSLTSMTPTDFKNSATIEWIAKFNPLQSNDK